MQWRLLSSLMKRAFFLFIVFFGVALWGGGLCYSVEVAPAKNLQQYKNTKFPDSCRVIDDNIQKYIYCGCYRSKKDISVYFDFLKRKFHTDLGVVVLPLKSFKSGKKVEQFRSSSLQKVKKNAPLKKSFVDKTKVCTTLQLFTLSYTYEKLLRLKKRTFPKGCEIMHIGKTLTVRCGCFDKNDPKKERYFNKIRKRYFHTKVTETYAYRFKKKVNTRVFKKLSKTKKQHKNVRTITIKHKVKKQQKKIVEKVVLKPKVVNEKKQRKHLRYAEVNTLYKQKRYKDVIDLVEKNSMNIANSQIYLLEAKSAEALGEQQKASEIYQKIIFQVAQELDGE